MLFAVVAYPISWYVSYALLTKRLTSPPLLAALISTVLSSIPLAVYSIYHSRRDACLSKSVQRWWIWRVFQKYFDATISLEEPLDDNQLYIFCCFPHGACTANHLMTMTDSCEMLSKHYKGERRDLAASVLFMVPFLGELLLNLGCVDACSYTANYNLKKNRSILVFIGGEREQLMTEQGKHKIYLKSRKGFIKLALQHGAALVPIYTFGETDVYTISAFMLGFRQWLQKTFAMAVCITWGRWGTIIPHKVPLRMEMGKPILVSKKLKETITQGDIDSLHTTFMNEQLRLFDRTKSKHAYGDAQLEIY